MRGQLFYVFQEGHRLTTSRAAFYDAARKLIEQGHDPQALLIMRHAGSDVDCLKQPPPLEWRPSWLLRIATSAACTSAATGRGLTSQWRELRGQFGRFKHEQ